MKMGLHLFITLLKQLEKASELGVHIPEDLRQRMGELSQQVADFLRESDEEIELKKRKKTMEQMFLFIWITFFNNVLQKNDDYYRTNFDLYGTYLFNGKDHGKTAVATDIREKIQAIHEMLKSWPHMVPPRIEDIHFPDSRLKNDMIYESPGEYGIKPIVAEYGFVEPPSLKPDARLLSIEEYLANEYKIEDDYVRDSTVIDFANFARDPDSQFYDPHESDPTFLSDVVKKYGSNRYLDVYQKFRGLLSDYHLDSW